MNTNVHVAVTMPTFTPTAQTCVNVNDGTIQLAAAGGNGGFEYGVRKTVGLILK